MARPTHKERITRELLAGKDRHGLIYPEERLAWAQTHPNSEMYQVLDARGAWDDARMAHERRIELVQELIAIYLVDTSGQRTTVSLEIDRYELKENGLKGGYRELEDVRSDRDLLEELHNLIEHEFRRLRDKWASEDEFRDVFEAIDKMVARRHRARSRTRARKRAAGSPGIGAPRVTPR